MICRCGHFYGHGGNDLLVGGTATTAGAPIGDEAEHNLNAYGPQTTGQAHGSACPVGASISAAETAAMAGMVIFIGRFLVVDRAAVWGLAA